MQVGSKSGDSSHCNDQPHCMPSDGESYMIIYARTLNSARKKNWVSRAMYQLRKQGETVADRCSFTLYDAQCTVALKNNAHGSLVPSCGHCLLYYSLKTRPICVEFCM